jgi:hypothetical protein
MGLSVDEANALWDQADLDTGPASRPITDFWTWYCDVHCNLQGIKWKPSLSEESRAWFVDQLKAKWNRMDALNRSYGSYPHAELWDPGSKTVQKWGGICKLP